MHILHEPSLIDDVVLPGESTPRISARLIDEKGDLLLELNLNWIGENPGKCTYHPLKRGQNTLFFRRATIGSPHPEFPKGHLKHIKARLFDEIGDLRLRMEPLERASRSMGTQTWSLIPLSLFPPRPRVVIQFPQALPENCCTIPMATLPY